MSCNVQLIAQTARNMLSDIKTFVLNLLFPVSCLGCREPETLLCRACLEALPSSEPVCLLCSRRNRTGNICSACRQEAPHIDKVLWGTSYKNSLARDVIVQFKYNGERQLALPLASLMIPPLKDALKAESEKNHAYALVPMPLTRRKERERGFNQADLLGREVAKACAAPLLPAGTLTRIRYTQSQTQFRERNERRENIAGAFRVTNPEAIRGKTIVIVDDIATTGATLNEAARVLKENGVMAVWGLVAAKG